MEPFSISCTTCKAQLRVTNAKAFGEILPCPKCSSMVLVPDAHPFEEHAGVAEPSADSFENIDELIDGTAAPTALPQDSIKPETGRWRIPENAKASVGPADRIEPKSNVPSSAEMEMPVAAELESSASSLLRKVFFVSGGVVLGTAIAVGLTVVLSSNEDDSAISTNPAPPVIESRSDDHQEEVKTDEPANEVQEIPSAANPTSEPTEAIPESEETDEPIPDDPLPTDPTANLANELQNEQPVPAEPTPELEIADVDQENESASRPILVPLEADDDLSEFARWLQDDDDEPALPRVDPDMVETLPSSVSPPVAVMQPTRAEPELVDVKARLADKINAIQFDAVELSSVLRSITRFSTIPITIEPDALHYRQMDTREKVTVRALESNIESLLAMTLAKVNLDFQSDEGHVVVTTSGAKNRRPIRVAHDVSDLCETSEAAERLLAELRRLVDFEVWPENGGIAKAEVESRQIAITHFDLTHFRVLRFLERLRMARGLPTKSKLEVDKTSFPRFQAASVLGEFVSLRFASPMGLIDIAESLESQTRVNVLIDWRALHFAGWSVRDKVDFFRDNQRLGECLTELLNPMGLTFLVIDDSTVLITSRQDSFRRHEIEFYSIPQDQTDTFTNRIDVVSKRYPSTRIDYTYDQASRSMIVSAPQQVHRELAAE